MAHTSVPLRPLHPRSPSKGGLPISERQLDAYLLTRDTLRRVRSIAALTPDLRQPASPGASPPAPRT